MGTRQQITDALAGQFGAIASIQRMPSANNEVFRLDTDAASLIFKSYADKGAHEDVELFVRRSIGDSRFLRRLLLVDDSQRRYPTDYAVFEFVDGRTVLDALRSGDDVDWAAIVDQLYEFISSVTVCRIGGYGFVRSDGSTSHSDWRDFLLDYHTKSVRALLERGYGRPECAAAYKAIVDRWETLALSEPRLVPADLNVSNLLIRPDGSLIVIDPGAVVGGDPLFAVGELMGHTYTSPLWNRIRDRWPLRAEEMRTVRLYAACLNLNVLAFVARHTAEPLDTACPWGNGTPFAVLIEGHLTHLANDGE